MAHAVIYLATAPKSNSVTLALGKAKKEIQENPLQEVPLWLRDSHSKVSKNQGHGDGYLYSHDFPEAISGQEYLLKPTKLYEPTASGREKFILERLRYWRELKAELETQN